MTIDTETGSWLDFPDPIEEARALLEICRMDSRDARSLVAINVKFARTPQDLCYWSQVSLSGEPRQTAKSRSTELVGPKPRSEWGLNW